MRTAIRLPSQSHAMMDVGYPQPGREKFYRIVIVP
jgi:hypothetical protein